MAIMAAMKQTGIQIPYAVADFARLREEGYYYIDKTRFIRSLEPYSAPVFLRPRRFGKSLLVSMLYYYYDIRQAERFESIFGGTDIGNNPTSQHNKYMVLRLDFSTMAVADSLEQLEENFNNLICPAINMLVNGKMRYAKEFEGIHFANHSNAITMLRNVLDWISGSGLPQLYILIDEYDNFSNQLLTTFKDQIYERLTTGDSFFRNFFKVIKSGIGEGSIRSCFCTGVLPVTMDDLTSGYNISEILTLKPEFVDMLGFTHEEAAEYLKSVMSQYDERNSSFDELWKLILNNYDGYHFLPGAKPLFNPTILTYFFKKFAMNKGVIPDELIDENLRTDIGWIRRLTQTQENAQATVHTLLVDGEMTYSQAELRSKFNKQKFFDPEFYPVSLYYLGMTTLVDNFAMCLPNLSMRSIYMGYYNELNQVGKENPRYVNTYRSFVKSADHRLEPIIENYFHEYLGLLPAQAFDKMNENFIRCSCFELMSRYLSQCYTFALELNLPSGRADLVMTGVPGTEWHNDCRVVEFKYMKAAEAKTVEGMTAPIADDVAQVNGYAADILAQFPAYKIQTYVVYMAAAKACKVFLSTD